MSLKILMDLVENNLPADVELVRAMRYQVALFSSEAGMFSHLVSVLS